MLSGGAGNDPRAMRLLRASPGEPPVVKRGEEGGGGGEGVRREMTIDEVMRLSPVSLIPR